MNDNKNKKRNKLKGTTFFKENTIIIGLYSIVGILVVVAVSLTFFNPTPNDETLVALEDAHNVSSNLADSYKTQIAQNPINEEKTTPEEINKDEVKQPDKPQPQTDTTTSQNIQKPEPAIEKSEPTKESTTNTDDVSTTDNELIIYEDDQTLTNAQPSDSLNSDDDKDLENDTTADDDDEGEDDDKDDKSTDTASFYEDDKMLWPIEGEIVSVYSPETLVYDSTLEQYKTTNSIDIQGEQGQDVFASYDGVVKNISNSMEQGNYVTLDHGDGWVTTYSQLNDRMKVSIGDEVTKGQQLGTIAEPTNKSILLGSHLDFKVTKNNETVDPLIVLE